MSHYSEIIKNSLSVSFEEAAQIEDFIRTSIVRGPLDHLSKSDILRASKIAKECISMIAESPKDENGLYII